MKRYKIVNMKRFICFIIAVVAIIALTVITINSVINRSTYKVIDYTTTTVTTGDNIWSIANTINPGIDNRVVVSDIININNWDKTPVIKTGDIISIPVYK